jgi:hypothetical protein
MQNNKKSSEEWSSINDLNKNIIISGSKILSDSSKDKDDKKYQQTSKNINMNFSNYSSNDDKIKSSIFNKV